MLYGLTQICMVTSYEVVLKNRYLKVPSEVRAYIVKVSDDQKYIQYMIKNHIKPHTFYFRHSVEHLEKHLTNFSRSSRI